MRKHCLGGDRLANICLYYHYLLIIIIIIIIIIITILINFTVCLYTLYFHSEFLHTWVTLGADGINISAVWDSLATNGGNL